MSAITENSGAWILSPYCFCADRPWLSVSEVWRKDPDIGGGITPILGLSNEDSALLAALLTALGVFLLLLLLLLCLFCPCCLCCRRLCPCCFKGKSSGKTASRGASGIHRNTVNLTAVGMKIPRVWTDSDTGFSDSELGKRRKIWQETKDGQWMGYGGQGVNKAAKTGNVQFNGWMSGQDLSDDKVEGYNRFSGGKELNKGSKESNGEIVALTELYRNPSNVASSTIQHRRNSYSSILEKLMTPHSKSRPYTDYNNGEVHSYSIPWKSTANYSSYDYFGRELADQTFVTKGAQDGPKANDFWHNIDEKDFTNRAVNSKTGDSVQNFTTQTESTRTSGYDSAVHTSTLEPSVVNSLAIASSATVDNTSDFLRETGVRSEVCNPSYNQITETTSYMKRVVEETETATTG